MRPEVLEPVADHGGQVETAVQMAAIAALPGSPGADHGLFAGRNLWSGRTIFRLSLSRAPLAKVRQMER